MGHEEMKQFIPQSLEYVFFTQLADPKEYPVNSETFSFLAGQINVLDTDTLSSPIYFGNKIEQAIEFLQKASNTQRTAEKRAITNFINKIKSQYPKRQIPKYLDEVLGKIESFSTEDLVTWINLIRQTTDDYLHRLQELRGKADRTTSIELMAQKEASAFLLSQNIDFSEDKSDRNLDVFMQKTKKGVIETDTLTLKEGYKTIQQALMDVFKPEIESAAKMLAPQLPKKDNNELEKILYAAIFLDLSHYLQNISITIQDFIKKEKEVMIGKIKDYRTDGTFFTQLLLSNDSASMNQLSEIAKNLETLLNVQIHTLKKSKSTTSGVQFFKNRITKSKKINRWKLNVQSLSKWIPEKGNYVTIKMPTKTSQGNFYEAIMTLFYNAINVKGNAGTDVLFYSGQLTIDSNKLLKEIESKISNDFSKQQGILLEQSEKQQQQDKSIESWIDTQKTLNTDIKQTIENYLTSIESTKKIINDFISYDTMKMYWGDDGSLEGRDMQLLPALAKISAVVDPSEITFADIYPFVLNMSDTTIPGAHSSKIHDQLEDYLSYLAALLMFDNLEGVLEPTITIEKSSINQLYLYNFQGRFYPMSVILNKIIDNFKAIRLKEIDSLGVKGKLTQTSPKFPGRENYETENAWREQKNQTMQNTKIKIIFAASFATWLRDLFNS